MTLRHAHIHLTTNGSGDASGTAERTVIGRLYCVQYDPGDIATGATLTVVCAGHTEEPLLTKANAGTSAVWFYPRRLMHAVSDGSALTGTAGGDRCQPVMDGLPTVTIASGGASHTGHVTLFWDEG